MTTRPYATSTFELDGDLAIRVTVARAGDPVEVEFGASTLMLPPGLCMAVGRALLTAARSSMEGKKRQVARAEAEKAAQDAEAGE
jgi:hypothetical protein